MENNLKKSLIRGDLADELADVLWVLTCIANQTGINLEEAMKKNFGKENIKDINRHKNNDKLKILDLYKKRKLS